MKRNQRALLQLTHIGISGCCSCKFDLTNVEWPELFSIAIKQGVIGLGMRALEILHKQEIDTCPFEIKLQWYALAQQTYNYLFKKQVAIGDFVDKMKPLKIAALKGIDYARYWPNPLWREFGDLDCCLAEGDGKDIDKKTVEFGGRYEDGGYKHSHLFYKGLMIENHYAFTDFAGTANGKLLEEELRRLFYNDFKTIGETSLLSPNANFTAVFMIAHAQNHFFYEGLTLRQILDWHFFLQKEERNVDWDRVNGILESTQLMPFAILMTQFCKRYFNLQCSFDSSSCKEDLLNRFTEDLFADKYNDFDRRWNRMVFRIINRFTRSYKFRLINKMTTITAIWRTFSFSSFLHRKPKLS